VGSTQQTSEPTTDETLVGRCADSASTGGQQEEASGGEVSNGKIAFSRNSDIYVIDGEGAHENARVKAIVSDSPFASERKLVRSLLKKRLNPIHGPVAALTERLLPYDPGKVEPLKEVARIAPRATMFIHGLRDKTCEPTDSVSSTRRRRNLRSCGC
jgi:hypothetical protein